MLKYPPINFFFHIFMGKKIYKFSTFGTKKLIKMKVRKASILDTKRYVLFGTK